MALGTNQQFYKDSICQISSLIDVWFDLLLLSKFTKDIFGKTRKMSKNSQK